MLDLLPKAFGCGGPWLGASILLGLLGVFAWPGAAWRGALPSAGAVGAGRGRPGDGVEPAWEMGPRPAAAVFRP